MTATEIATTASEPLVAGIYSDARLGRLERFWFFRSALEVGKRGPDLAALDVT